MSNFELKEAIENAHEKVQKTGTAQPQYKTWQAHLTALTAEQRRRAEARTQVSGGGEQ